MLKGSQVIFTMYRLIQVPLNRSCFVVAKEDFGTLRYAPHAGGACVGVSAQLQGRTSWILHLSGTLRVLERHEILPVCVSARVRPVRTPSGAGRVYRGFVFLWESAVRDWELIREILVRASEKPPGQMLDANEVSGWEPLVVTSSHIC
jgi:hypothetical protein